MKLKVNNDNLEDYLTPELELAYEIDSKLYEGKSITDAERAFYDKTVGNLYLTLTGEDKSASDAVPFSLRIWLMYATKSVSYEWKEKNIPHYGDDD